MKTYLVSFDWTPSGPEASVVIASTPEEAMELAHYWGDNKPGILDCEEIRPKKGIIYTGYNHV